MNKKAQLGYIGTIILFIFFVLNWFLWLGSWINTVGEIYITTNGAVGFEAFFFSNLNFVVFISMILGMLGFMYFSSSK